MNVTKSTVVNVIAVFGERWSTARKTGSRGNRKPKATKTSKKGANCFKRNSILSARDVASKLNVSSTTVYQAKKQAGSSVVTPNPDDKQNKSIEEAKMKMLTYFDCMVEDEETYVMKDLNQLLVLDKEYHTTDKPT